MFKNKYIYIALLISMIIVGISIFQFYNEYLIEQKLYDQVIENCYEGKNVDHKVCQGISKEHLEWYATEKEVNWTRDKLDTMTFTYHVLQFTYFHYLQIFAPLIIIFAVVKGLHSEMSSGMCKNYFLRDKYKKYINNNFKFILKAALIIPITLIVIFLIGGIYTRFNFNVNDYFKDYVVYNPFGYDHFFLHGFLILLIQYLLGVFHGVIALMCCRKTKNSILAIILSFVIVFLFYLFVFLIIYAFIFIKLLHIKNLSEIFNMMGFWFFDNSRDITGALIVSIITCVTGIIVYYASFKNKEKMCIDVEEQTA